VSNETLLSYADGGGGDPLDEALRVASLGGLGLLGRKESFVFLSGSLAGRDCRRGSRLGSGGVAKVSFGCATDGERFLYLAGWNSGERRPNTLPTLDARSGEIGRRGRGRFSGDSIPRGK
jgi:hypothetical protein